MKISDFLLTGKKNGISMTDLAHIANVPERIIRKEILQARIAGELIVSGDQGYYLAADDLILHEGSGGASYNLSVIYVLNGSELELLSGIVMADEECFEIFGDRESIFMDRKPGDRSITRDEYYQIMDEQESQLTLMELIPF